ncbi:MAG: hypothetical protein LBM59_02395 [Ruminococcus sp.]|jgi:hypothetical protein|nr:hypothetical protein [Ruminococcus sp.]
MEQEKRQLTEGESEKVAGGADNPPDYDEILRMMKEAMEVQKDINREMYKKY